MNRNTDSGAAAPRSGDTASHRHVLVAQLRDRPNTLERTVGLFRQRGYAIERLTWTPGEAPGSRRLEVVVETDRVDLLIRQLERLVDVVAVEAGAPAR